MMNSKKPVWTIAHENVLDQNFNKFLIGKIAYKTNWISFILQVKVNNFIIIESILNDFE